MAGIMFVISSGRQSFQSIGRFQTITHQFSISCTCLDKRWRRRNGLSENPNSYGPLTNLPDFRYKDGRPGSLGSGQKQRLDKQRHFAETVVKLSQEMDFAVERRKQTLQEEQEARELVLRNKLKPKGLRGV